MPIEQASKVKADFDAVPVIDFALSKTDREAYFKQLKFAVEDVGFGVSYFTLFSPLRCHLLTESAIGIQECSRL